MKHSVNFTKMHSLGNDFIIMDTIVQYVPIHSSWLTTLAHRRLGLGADQILILEPPVVPDADFFVRIFNSDGAEVGQCLNGLRCIGRYIVENELCKPAQKTLIIGTQSGSMKIDISKSPDISITLPPPKFEPKLLPTTLNPVNDGVYHWEEEGLDISLVYVGNPHAIIFVPEINRNLLRDLHKKLLAKRVFPNGVNTSIVQVIARNHIKMQTYERGAGPTMACGSAAVAAVATGIKRKELANTVQVNMLSGSLDVSWPAMDAPITLTGPTVSTARGQVLVKNPNYIDKSKHHAKA